MELYFEPEDIRSIYRWNETWDGMQYLAICELASGDQPECHRTLFDNQDDLIICIQAKLTMLTAYNYLSEV
jgi:hypothetical protein